MLDSLLHPHSLPKEYTPHRVNGIHRVEPGQTVVMADVDGPGCIRHLFVTMPPKDLRRLVLRWYWDNEKTPSVECPVPDFFGVGHDETTNNLSCPLFYVAPKYGYNCYAPMPFGKRALVTLTNEGAAPCLAFYVMIGVHKYPKGVVPPWRFHGVWRRVLPAYRRGQPFTLMEAKGDGRLLGVIYHICKRDSDDRWSHGGGDQMFIDGETAAPGYVYGVGGEDFAHHAWGLAPALGPYSGAAMIHPVPGVKRSEGPVPFESHGWEQHDWGRYSMHRFFIPDPIPFRHSMRLAFGTCANELSATTYWYQTEPHASFAILPKPEQRGFGVRVTEEENTTPIPIGQDIPVAVLGPLMKDGAVWSPREGVELLMRRETDVRQPYGDVFRPPHEIRWRRASLRGGFIDLAAIHRPKCALRPRALWNYRHLPLGVMSWQLIRVRSARARKALLRIGYEDTVRVWHNGKDIATLNRPEPLLWHTEDVPLSLKAGVNDVLFGATQDRMTRWSAWGVYAKFLTPAGKVITDLTFDDFASLDPTPERFREVWPPEEPVACDNPRDTLFLI